MDKLLISAMGMVLLYGIYWFFFGDKKDDTTATDTWNITVEGGYSPKSITIPRGKMSTVTFTRHDTNDCLEELVIPEFHITTFLPLHTPIKVSLSPTKPGTYEMHCSMNMFHGSIRVV